MKEKLYLVGIVSLLLWFVPQQVYGMHIMEGYLAPVWCISWVIVCVPFLRHGYKEINKMVQDEIEVKMFLAMAGAYVFVLSALKLPSVTGSCSHPTGTSLGTILFGPSVMSILSLLVLIFQALLLAHGGITTLGANTFSMGIVGPIVTYLTFKLVCKSGGSSKLGVFLGTMLGSVMTYVVAALQLALAWPDATNGFLGAFEKYLGIFALTQIPIAVSEAVLTVLILEAMLPHMSTTFLSKTGFLKGGFKSDEA